MQAAVGDPKYWKTCVALFGCGTPFATDAGAEALLKAPDIAKVKQLIADAGYRGERIVLLDATDQPVVHAQALVTLAALKQAGLNVELQSLDWGTVITRRASKAPIDQGGWNIFHTWISAPDLQSPAVNAALRANDGKAWFGWPSDPKLEGLIDQWFKAADLSAQRRIVDQIQTEAYQGDVPYVPTGQFVAPTAYRKDLHGIIISPVVFFWNVAKD
jgi:peptide/nickel transport system substrate-binding protein